MVIAAEILYLQPLKQNERIKDRMKALVSFFVECTAHSFSTRNLGGNFSAYLA